MGYGNNGGLGSYDTPYEVRNKGYGNGRNQETVKPTTE